MIKLVGKDRIDQSITYLMNPYDEIALAAALDMKAQAGGGEVIAISLGPERALKTLQTALAMGADRGVLIRTNQELDSRNTSRVLHKALMDQGPPDLVFCGREAIDSRGMQTMHRLGVLLHMPVVNDVAALELLDAKLRLTRETDGAALEVLEAPVSCVIGAAKGLAPPAYPDLRAIVAAQKKTIEQINIDGLAMEPVPAHQLLMELLPLGGERRRIMLQGDAAQMAEQLAEILVKREGLI